MSHDRNKSPWDAERIQALRDIDYGDPLEVRDREYVDDRPVSVSVLVDVGVGWQPIYLKPEDGDIIFLAVPDKEFSEAARYMSPRLEKMERQIEERMGRRVHIAVIPEGTDVRVVRRERMIQVLNDTDIAVEGTELSSAPRRMIADDD